MKFKYLPLFLFSLFLKSNNSVTLNTYENGLQKYIDKTPKVVDGAVKNWIEKFLTFVPKDKTIFEFGSGFGRDAAFIESLGYKVNRSDAANSFVDYLKNNGLRCSKFNLLTDNFKNSYSAFFANAVFLHFTRKELDLILGKIRKSLNFNGVLAFSLKCGQGEGYESEKLGDKRYFCYWQPDQVNALLTKHGLKVLSLEQDADKLWIYVIAQYSGPSWSEINNCPPPPGQLPGSCNCKRNNDTRTCPYK